MLYFPVLSVTNDCARHTIDRKTIPAQIAVNGFLNPSDSDETGPISDSSFYLPVSMSQNDPAVLFSFLCCLLFCLVFLACVEFWSFVFGLCICVFVFASETM